MNQEDVNLTYTNRFVEQTKDFKDYKEFQRNIN